MPPVDGLLEVAIHADDVPRPVAFYQCVFGFDLIAEGDRPWALGAGTRQVLLS